MQEQRIIQAVRQWVERIVIGLNLCPFAKRELVKNRIRFSVVNVDKVELLLEALNTELELIFGDNSIETTLLIVPNFLKDFYDYNQFLDLSDKLLKQMDFEGIFQIATFHPDYQFDGTEPDDVENYTNRSPYPILHILREESLEKAIDNYSDVDKIPEKNITLLKSMGIAAVKDLLV